MNLCFELFILLLVILCQNCTGYVHDPDIYRNVSEIIAARGYPVENHVVQTEDGYLLSVQRIPHGRDGMQMSQKRPPVLLQHGILCSSVDWVINLPEQSLGFLLADLGYDVWLGNSRGNTYSEKHVKLKPSMSSFWKFSFDEMGKYDLPAVIDYILNKTEEDQLFYVGHSQGTTEAFALLSERPVYNQKIKLFIALAPVATVGYIKTLRFLSLLGVDLNWFLDLVGIHQFFPRNELVEFISDKFCETIGRPICNVVLYEIFGWSGKNMNETRLPVYLAHHPAGASTQSVIHYAQLVLSRKFSKYDYGSQNWKHYNQSTPPEYDVTKITTPIALFWALKDTLADFIDVSLLERQLQSLVLSYCVHDGDFQHQDFVYHLKAPQLVYNQVLLLMKKYLDDVH